MKIIFTRSAAKSLRHIPQYVVQKIAVKVDSLADNPFPLGASKLTEKPGYRLRVGDYRMIYELDKLSQTITIIAIAHRREVYRLNDAAREKSRYTTHLPVTTETAGTAPQMP